MYANIVSQLVTHHTGHLIEQDGSSFIFWRTSYMYCLNHKELRIYITDSVHMKVDDQKWKMNTISIRWC